MTASAPSQAPDMARYARQSFRAWAALGSDCVVIDTETTGLDAHDEVIEVAVADMYGRTLINERVRPTRKIPLRAFQVHGIRDEHVANCPQWPDVWPRLEEVLAGRIVVAYNASFDVRLVRQTLAAQPFAALGLPTEAVTVHGEAFELPISPVLRRWRCAMSAHKAYRGLKRCGKLSEACIVEGVDISDLPDAHGALGDVLRTVRLIRAVAARA